MMQYHYMGPYTEGPGEGPVMSGLSVQMDPSLYQESFYYNYPPVPYHQYQEQDYQQNVAVQQQPQHQHSVQQQELGVQSSAPQQGEKQFTLN